MKETFIESLFSQEGLLQKADEPFEQSLRPKRLSEFIGQESVCQQLSVLLEAALKRKEPLGHILFSGPPGLGKTSLSHILAESMGTKLVVTSGPAIERPADLAIELSALREGEIFFIDEIHRLNTVVEEYLYSAMEDFVLDIPKSARIPLSRFTLVGATTRPGLLSSPFRSRFMFTTRLDFYDVKALSAIIERSSQLLHFPLDTGEAEEIAKRSRGTPRVANRLLRWVRDFSCTRYDGVVSKNIVCEALKMLRIDASGLEEMDLRVLHCLVEQFDGGPVGLKTLATAISEEVDTLEDVHEPFLISLGLLKKTPKGREATSLGIDYVKNHMKACKKVRN